MSSQVSQFRYSEDLLKNATKYKAVVDFSPMYTNILLSSFISFIDDFIKRNQKQIVHHPEINKMYNLREIYELSFQMMNYAIANDTNENVSEEKIIPWEKAMQYIGPLIHEKSKEKRIDLITKISINTLFDLCKTINEYLLSYAKSVLDIFQPNPEKKPSVLEKGKQAKHKSQSQKTISVSKKIALQK